MSDPTDIPRIAVVRLLARQWGGRELACLLLTDLPIDPAAVAKALPESGLDDDGELSARVREALSGPPVQRCGLGTWAVYPFDGGYLRLETAAPVNLVPELVTLDEDDLVPPAPEPAAKGRKRAAG